MAPIISMMTGSTLMRISSQEYGRGAVASDLVIQSLRQVGAPYQFGHLYSESMALLSRGYSPIMDVPPRL